MPQVSFNNYVDMILLFFDHLPTSTWTCFTLKWTKMEIFGPPTHLILSTQLLNDPPEPNKMICISEEREKGWNIIDESSFSTVREYPIFSKLF